MTRRVLLCQWSEAGTVWIGGEKKRKEKKRKEKGTAPRVQVQVQTCVRPGTSCTAHGVVVRGETLRETEETGGDRRPWRGWL